MNSNVPPLDFYLGKGRRGTKYCFGELFSSLMQVPLMRERFFNLTGRILRERFAAEEVLAELDSCQGEYTPLMKRQAERWKDFSFNSWEIAMNTFRAVLAKRPALVVKYFQRAYSLDEEEMNRYFGEFVVANAMKSQP